MNGASYARLAEGAVARTIEASLLVHVDVDDGGRVRRVEVLDGSDWRDALASLAMTGRLRVAPG